MGNRRAFAASAIALMVVACNDASGPQKPTAVATPVAKTASAKSLAMAASMAFTTDDAADRLAPALGDATEVTTLRDALHASSSALRAGDLATARVELGKAEDLLKELDPTGVNPDVGAIRLAVTSASRLAQ
jgi:hypothetical protein